ncbi:xylitol dehydrogenase [Infundibulicybe gibba]|nr:xylitol dehydrogenase [Infundibulicybe gibba]
MSDNLSFILQDIEKVAFEQRPIPQISDDDVLIEVKKTGPYYTSLAIVHFLVDGRIGDFIVKSPMVLGHESAGIISKIGQNVKHLKVGDRVAIEPAATCRKCEVCKAGRYELCANIVAAAAPPHDGTLGRYYRVPADFAYPLPEGVSFEDGAMMEPLSVAVHSVSNLGGFKANQSIVIFGCGPVGLLCMAVAKALGAARIIAVDIVPARLEFAKQYAATDTFSPPKPKDGESRPNYSRRNAAIMKEQLGIADQGKGGIDLVLDASVQTALFVTKAGGTFVQVGMGPPNININIGMVVAKEITIKGSFRYGPGDYPLAIDLVSRGKVDLKPLVTHRFVFNDAIVAFQATRKGKSEDGKGVIKAMISGPDFPADAA